MEITFKDGTGVTLPDVAKYLGCYLYETGDVGKELGRKLAEATTRLATNGYLLEVRSMFGKVEAYDL